MAKAKYDKYFLSYQGEEPKFGDYKSLLSEPPFPEIAGPQTYFRGSAALPGATANMGWQVFTAPVCWETVPHVHKYDEFLIFLGASPPDLCHSYDAEVDLWMGKELEKHTISSATVVFIPKGVLHCPLNFRKINKPILFHALYLGGTLDSARVKDFDEEHFDFEGPVNLRRFPKTKPQ